MPNGKGHLLQGKDVIPQDTLGQFHSVAITAYASCQIILMKFVTLPYDVYHIEQTCYNIKFALF